MARSSSGMNENLAALLCYVLGIITGLFFFITEKKSELVRFHALQSSLFFMAWMVIQIIVAGILIMVPSLLRLFISLIHILGIIIWIIMMTQAYRGKYYLLPVIGKISLDNSRLKTGA